VAHDALGADHVLSAQLVRVGAAGGVGIDHDLHDAGGVTHVEEHDAAVVTTARNPAADADLLAAFLAAQVPATVRAHHRSNSQCSRSQPAS
jgi:hypothetical protein